MAWAAPQQTTRTEDLAYCLLGVFQVAVPLIHGEDERAFIRLQKRDLFKKTNDLMLPAWTVVGATINWGPPEARDNPEFTVSDEGHRIHQEFREISKDKLFMGFRCKEKQSKELGIILQHAGHAIYIRSHTERLENGPRPASTASIKSIYISMTQRSELSQTLLDDAQNYNYPTRFAMVFGFKDSAYPWVCLATKSSDPSLYSAAAREDLQTLGTLGPRKLQHEPDDKAQADLEQQLFAIPGRVADTCSLRRLASSCH
ncbi:hypothetical protein BJ170DRAFT_723861 [Xylariales sp. AK1849]|nr:hypothetical protein BJ170DRAFT_723861 [Xylariales sp. AK1849]